MVKYNSIKNEGVEDSSLVDSDIMMKQKSHFSRNRGNTFAGTKAGSGSVSVDNLMKPIDYIRLISLSKEDLDEED